MGLPFILAVRSLLSSSGNREEEDVEKGGEGSPGDEHAADVEDTDSDGDGDDVLDDPLADGPRRLHRLSSATKGTFFSNRLPQSSTFDSLAPQRPLLTRLKSYVFPKDESEAALEKFIPNYRWTPILSGVVIPFSILLEIPGLTEHWYIRTEANQIVDTKPNSVILDVALAFSMGCGLFANICLVLRFLEKRVKTVTLLTIMFLTSHDIINILCVTIFGVEHRFDDGFTYGQSFWLTVCSTAASTVSNVTLIVDFVRTPAFAQSGSGLTRKQRALMIIVIVLLVYIAFGALFFSLIQSLSFIDGLYFSVVTIETIGFGDIVPTSTGGRFFTCFYMVFGVINLGVAVAMTRETVLEGLELGYRKRLRDLRLRKREARRFRRWEARWQRAVEWRLREMKEPIWVSDKYLGDEDVHFVGLGKPKGAGEVHWFKRWLETLGLRKHHEGENPREFPPGKHLNIDALSPQQREAAALEAGVPLEMFLTSRKHSSSDDRASLHSQDRLGARDSVRKLALSVWPTHSQTPTHAQVGRMAAMISKFAFAVTGTHVHMIGHDVDRHAEETQQKERATQQEQVTREAQATQEAAPKEPDPVWSGHDIPTTTPTSNSSSDFSEEPEEIVQKPRANLPPESQQDMPVPPPVPKNVSVAMEGTLLPNVSPRTKELARGGKHRAQMMYDQFNKDVQEEEKKAHIVKLTISWSLFILFWMVGSAIFMKTEEWTYGDAMYFCVVAFMTTGYGDFSPTSPVGRSVFVVWALLGVATMTILIAVIEEAGSSRYKRALHSKTFDNAVKKYRQRENDITNQIAAQNRPKAARSHSTSTIDAAIEAAQTSAMRELEGLPNQIIHHSRTFFDQMRYLVEKGGQSLDMMESTGEIRTRIPMELKELLDEIAQYEEINERAKREILEDNDSRNTLLMLSIERTLRTLINSAERALSALAERDNLLETHQSRTPGASGTPEPEDTQVRDFGVRLLPRKDNSSV